MMSESIIRTRCVTDFGETCEPQAELVRPFTITEVKVNEDKGWPACMNIIFPHSICIYQSIN